MNRRSKLLRSGRDVAIFFAGTYRAQRMHWLQEARTAKKFSLRTELIPLYIAYAKCAHCSYLIELRRAA